MNAPTPLSTSTVMDVEYSDVTPPRPLSRPQKAAIVVRFLMSQGIDIPIERLSTSLQAELTQNIANLDLIDRGTLSHVLGEFLGQLGDFGLPSGGGLGGALGLLGEKLGPEASAQIKTALGVGAYEDPWDHICTLDEEVIQDFLKTEGPEISAVILSKLPAARAAKILGALEGPKARELSFAMSMTEGVSPDVVARIGQSLLSQISSKPPRAFGTSPAERVGAILTCASNATREQLLQDLEEDDPLFAAAVRKAVFTFADIPKRVAGADIPNILRSIDQETLIIALAFGQQSEETTAVEHILGNMSKRMAGTLREEMTDLGEVSMTKGEDAMNILVGAIREAATRGDITFMDQAT